MNAIRQALDLAIAEAESGQADFIVLLQDPVDPRAWLQVSWDSLNFPYPLPDHPTTALRDNGLKLPAFVTLSAWEALRYATFEHGAEPLDEIAAFANAFLSKIAGVDPLQLVRAR
jgi:hypothetical protein